MKKALLVLFAFMLSVNQSSCTAPDRDDITARLPREQTLYVGGFKWGAPSTFNRLAADPGFGIDYNLEIIYESLFGYNQRLGKLVPILATSYKQHDSVIDVTLDKRARWNDGMPVTVEDVVYTFELDKKYPTPRHANWQYLSFVSGTNDSTITFGCNPHHYNPLLVLDMLAEVSIVPKKVYGQVERSCWIDSAGKADYMKMLQFRNDSAIIASGPYTLYRYSDQKVILKRVDNYWGNCNHGGNAPAPRFIVHSLYQSNSAFNAAMTKGLLDLSCNYMPRIWEQNKNRIRAWSMNAPFHLPGCIPTLFLALERPPLDDVAFRNALIHAIDFDKISRLAFSNYSPALQPGLILPFGPESTYYAPEDAKRYGYTFDISKAREILRNAGYSWNAALALVDRNGQPVRSLSVECPAGWSDWENTIRIAIDGFRMLGIDAQERFVDYGLWDMHAKKGTFDLLMRTTTSERWPSTPWRRINQLLSSENYRPVGQEMQENFGRYRNATADSLLALLPTITDPVKATLLYRQLNILFMQEIPVLPLMYRPAVFYQFSEKHWTDFPTEENPYAPPQMLMIGAGIAGLWGITPVKEGI